MASTIVSQSMGRDQNLVCEVIVKQSRNKSMNLLVTD
jgi:hypothetical protein